MEEKDLALSAIIWSLGQLRVEALKDIPVTSSDYQSNLALWNTAMNTVGQLYVQHIKKQTCELFEKETPRKWLWSSVK